MPTMTAEALDFVEEFADNPAAESELLHHYLDRYRRVTVGPSVSLVFENANTLQFRVREVQNLQRIYSPAGVRRMFDWYSSLLPGTDQVSAAVSVRIPGRRPSAGLNVLADSIAAGSITLQVGTLEIPGIIRPIRAGDRVLGPAFWVTFPFDDTTRAAMLETLVPAVVSLVSDAYVWDSDPLTADVRQSLCEDLSRRV